MGSITDHNQLLAWVASLDIPEASGVKTRSRNVVARANAEDEGAAVVRGSITSFVTGLSQQARDDVQNSTLLMQLAADKKFNPEKQREEWFKFYTDGLANLGWGRVSSYYQSYQPRNTNVTMDQVVLEVIAAVVGADSAVYKVTEKTFSSLQDNPKNQAPLKLFDSSSTRDSVGTFQILPVMQDRDGNVVMVLTTVNASTTVQRGSFLFWSWSKTTAWMYRAAQQTVLNESVYATVRQSVIKKLGKNAEEFIDDLEI
ncbi:hypothetical protein PSFL_40370 [Pseudomonas sp. DD1]|jgi:hypothetical protein|uniref:hypothetical protein n=1 Tax=Pseudomonas TaxID=286 RepID=UPI0004938579|nr:MULTISPECIES: hypothetical protein [Pseudomonas]MBL7229338.1 hypothetical protein [Pseudomonas sp.]MDD1131305.1 hypothetical protein [Pseudomonas shahriarae]MDF3162824.1 hypothetical protein [Pseudomonas proteolytica]